MRIVFRCDAARHIGTGHVMRCITLATTLKNLGNEVLFVCRAHDGHLKDFLDEKGFRNILLKNHSAPDFEDDTSHIPHGHWLGVSQKQDAEETLQAINKWGTPDWIVVDHYGLDIHWETLLQSALNAHLLVIDDLADRQHTKCCLIDQTWQRHEKDYQNFLEKGSLALLGSPFMMLRPEFNQLRHMPRKQSRKITINFGGGNPQDSLQKVTRIIATTEIPKEWEIHLALGPNVVIDSALQDSITKLPVVVHQPAHHLAELLHQSDFAVGALGATTWERCCLGTPSIALCLADNQKYLSSQLEKTGAMLILPENFNEQSFLDYWHKLLNNSDNILDTLRAQALKICDGLGANRICKFMSDYPDTDAQLRLARNTESDIKQVYQWQLLPQTREFSRNTDTPEWANHQQWMQKQLSSELCHFYFICWNGTDCGVIRLNHREENKYEVSIFVDPEYFGKGIATKALKKITLLHPDLEILAFVLPENKASLALFKKAEYLSIGDNWYSKKPDTAA